MSEFDLFTAAATTQAGPITWTVNPQNLAMAAEGHAIIEAELRKMPVLNALTERFKTERFSSTQALFGKRICLCTHITPETGAMLLALKAAGARCYLITARGFSIQENIKAALSLLHDIPAISIEPTSSRRGSKHAARNGALEMNPELIGGCSAELVYLAIKNNRAINLIGATEQTSSGHQRLRQISNELTFPVIVSDGISSRPFFDNRFPTVQARIHAVLSAVNRLTKRRPVVLSLGWCGGQIAGYLQNMGARIVVVESDTLKSLQALMMGFAVAPMAQAINLADFAISASALQKAFEQNPSERTPGTSHNSMHHQNNGGNKPRFSQLEQQLNASAVQIKSRRELQTGLHEVELASGKCFYGLDDNWAANQNLADEGPATVIDLSLSNQILALEYLSKHHSKMPSGIYTLPDELEHETARLKLASLGIELARLSKGL